jgi:Na+/melibiose symporter-like transporter
MSTGMKMVWLIITYIINRLSINSLSIAHLSFISVSKNTQERLWLSARNIQFGIAATIIIAAIIPVVIHFYAVNFASLLFYTALILAMLQFLGYWNLFYLSGVYEKYDPDINKPSNKMSIEDLFTQVFGNSQLLILMVSDMIVIVGSLAVTMLAPYYFKHVTGDKDWVLYFSPAFLITGLLSALIAPYIILKFGKKKVYLFSLSWGVLCFIFLRIFGDSGPYIFTGIICTGGILSGFIAPMRQAMYMDVSEFGFNKTGKDVTAYIMSLHKMSLGIGGALAMAVVPFGLKILGFIPDMPVTDQFINGLMNMICFIPIVCGVIAVSLMSFYSLTDDKVVKIMEAHSK